MRNPELMRQVCDYASAEMKQTPGVSESAALELLASVALWLCEYYKHCDNPDKHPCPHIKPAMKGVHNLL